MTAAVRLGCTWRATSNALRRPRDELQDPLFVRTTRAMAPTFQPARLHALVTDALP